MTKERSNRLDFMTLMILAILLLQVALLAGLLFRTNQVYEMLMANGANLGSSIIESRTVNVSADDDPFIGPETAPVTIVEFSDFTCGYCRSVQDTLSQVRERYRNQVRIVYRDFPRTEQESSAIHAAITAECAAEQGKFEEMHDLLFEKQPRFDVESLQSYATSLNLDMIKFEQCFYSETQRADVVHDYEDGISYGVSATPTFFVNGYSLVGAAPFTEFARLIDRALQEAGDD